MTTNHIIRLGLCAGAIATLASFASVGGQNTRSVKVTRSARHHTAMKLHQRHEDGSYDSSNWSGYAVTGSSGAVTNVKGSWVVPAVNCATTPSGYSAFWVGIDGFSSSSVEQTGTDSDCVSLNGKTATPTYYAWFEFYPNPGYEIEFPKGVQPNDLITAEVKYLGQVSAGGHRGASGGLFTIIITDVTQGETYSTSATASAANESSAEWIAEAPCCSGRSENPLPLADFSSIQFSAGAATVQGATGAISSFGSNVQSITMVGTASPYPVKAQPSSLSGGAFSVTWFAQ